MKSKLLLIIVASLFGVVLTQAQSIRVSGIVRSAVDATPLAGVSISVKNSNVYAITDSNGKYSIDAPSGTDVLRYSFVGFGVAEIAIENRASIDVNLEDETQNLDEVVVMGYGTGQKLGTVVGSVTRISSETIAERPSSNALDALQGRVAGVQIFTSSGEPSANSSIRLHGVGSLGAGSSPLFVVDGTPVDGASFRALNRNDFESLTFLKDASATAIYGSRAANGVVYATTKRGRLNKDADIMFVGQYSMSSIADRRFFNGFMNAGQLADFWVETGYRTRAQVDKLRAEYPHDTRWMDYYYRDNVPAYEGILSVSGGSGKTTYYVSGGSLVEQGIAPRSNYSRHTLRSNIETQAKRRLKLGLNLSLAYGKSNTNGWRSNNLHGGLFWMTQPFYSPFDRKTGRRYDYIPGANKYNPWYLAEQNPTDDNDVRLIGATYVEIVPVDGLTLRSQAGIDGSDRRTTDLRMPSFLANPGNGTRSEKFFRNHIFTLTNTAEYRFTIADRHAVTLLGGQEFVDGESSSFEARAEGITDDRLILLGNGTSNKTVGQKRVQYAGFSLFARANYSFGDKYHANVNVREDRSSRFGKNNRSAVFVSGGVMWNVKNEDFLKDFRPLSSLKIRLSYGSSGNSEIGNYDHLSTVAANQYGGQPGRLIASPGNPNLSWEKQRTLSLSLNAGFFGCLNIDAEFYDRRTSDMLMSVPYPYSSGFGSILANVGKLLNRGVDLSVNCDVVATDDWHAGVSLVLNYNRNRVLELFQGRRQWTLPNTGVSYVVGKPVMFYYPLSAGVDPADGRQRWFLPNAADNSSVTRDPNRTTKSFANAALEQNTGKPRHAPLTGGFGFNASYGGLKIDAYFAYALDKYLVNNDRYFSSNPAVFAGYNQHTEILDYWKKPGDVAKFPKYGEAMHFDDGLIENASFMRLKSLTLSYELPKPLLKKTRFFNSAKIFATGRNLFTFTAYRGPDPEVDSNIALGSYPNTKQYSFGMELKF